MNALKRVMNAIAVELRGMPLIARWVTVGAASASVIGGIVGLVVGLFAYAPTAWFAVFELRRSCWCRWWDRRSYRGPDPHGGPPNQAAHHTFGLTSKPQCPPQIPSASEATAHEGKDGHLAARCCSARGAALSRGRRETTAWDEKPASSEYVGERASRLLTEQLAQARLRRAPRRRAARPSRASSPGSRRRRGSRSSSRPSSSRARRRRMIRSVACSRDSSRQRAGQHERLAGERPLARGRALLARTAGPSSRRSSISARMRSSCELRGDRARPSSGRRPASARSPRASPRAGASMSRNCAARGCAPVTSPTSSIPSANSTRANGRSLARPRSPRSGLRAEISAKPSSSSSCSSVSR